MDKTMLLNALNLTWKGMLSIFIVGLVLIGIIKLLGIISNAISKRAEAKAAKSAPQTDAANIVEASDKKD